MLLCAALGLPRPRNLLGLDCGGVVEAVLEGASGYRAGRAVDVDGDVDADGGVEVNVDSLRPRNRVEVEGVAGAPAPEAVEAEPIGGIGTTRATAFPGAPSSPPDRIETGGRANTALPWRGAPRQSPVGSGHWGGAARAAARQRAVQRDLGKRQSTGNGPIFESSNLLAVNFQPCQKISWVRCAPANPLSTLPISGLSSRRLGMEFLEEIRLRVGVTKMGQAMDARLLRERAPSCSCVRSCESANIGVQPSTKTLWAARAQSSVGDW